MKQIYIPGPYRVEVREVDPPQITSSDEVLIKSVITGVSAGTEMSFYRGTHCNLRTGKWGMINTFPLFPGYECVGTIIEKGENVSNLNIGDRVVCFGPHQEIVKMKVEKVARLPKTLSSEKALFSILNSTAVYAVYRADPRFGDGVVVIGAGVLGLLIFQNCKFAGAVTLAIADIDKNRLSMAKELDGDRTIDLSTENWKTKLNEIFPYGVDLVIEATGNPKAILTAIEIARAGGKVHISGYHTKACSILFGDDFMFKELTLTTSFSYGEKGAPYHPRFVRRPLERNFRLSVKRISEGKIQIPDSWITHRFSYRKIKEVYEMIDKKKENFLMVVLEWDQ